MNNSKVYNTFLRYLAVFIVPILSFAVLFFYNELNVTRKTVTDFNLSMLTQFGGEVDLSIAKLENIMLHMSGNDEMVRLPEMETVDQVKVLSSYESSVPDGMELLYYPRRTTNIYFDNDIVPYRTFESSGMYDRGLDFAGFFTSLTGAAYQSVIPIDQGNTRNSAYSAVVVAPIPLMTPNPNGTAAILIKKSFFEQIREKYFSAMPGEIYILDAKHSVLYASGKLMTQEELSAAIRGSRIGVNETTLDGKRFVIMRNVSSNLHYHYIAVIPYHDFYSTNISGVWSFTALVLLLIVFSALMAAVLARNFYRKVNIVEQKHELVASELKNRNDLIVQMVLIRLLNGSISDGDQTKLDYNLKCANLSFVYPLFTVAVCVPENLRVEQDAYDEVITSILGLSDSNAQFYAVLLVEENKLAIIINHNSERCDRHEFCRELNRKISDFPNINCTLGIGKSHTHPFHIDNSYVEALVSISEKMNRIASGGYLFEHDDSNIDDGFVYPYVEQALIEQSIRSGSSDIAVEAIRAVFAKIDCVAPSLVIQRCLHYDMVNMVVKIATTLDLPLKLHDISALSTMEDMKALRDRIESIILDLSKKAVRQQRQRKQSTKRELIEYVQEHFKENDLSLNRLAEEFNLSYSYISKIFKDETGCSFLAYITRLRFEYIKRELTQTSTPIKDIIVNSGYLDAANFMRKFKQNEGMTPGQYRQSFQKKK